MAMPVLAARAAAGTASPFDAAFDRLQTVFPALRVHRTQPGEPLPAGGDWITAAELAAGGTALESYLLQDETQVVRNYGQQPRPDVTATFGLHRYAWPLCLLITIPWFLHRRVPRVPLDAVSFHRTALEIAVRYDEFACLPGDPAADAPGAHVVRDEEALRAEVRASAADHLGPVLEGFRPRIRRGTRALWGMATDEITEGLWYIGHLLGEEERAMREAGELLPGATTPYARGASFRELTGPRGERLATRDRASCCLFYTLRPESTCVTCPRTCDAERVERLTAGR